MFYLVAQIRSQVVHCYKWLLVGGRDVFSVVSVGNKV